MWFINIIVSCVVQKGLKMVFGVGGADFADAIVIFLTVDALKSSLRPVAE